MDLTKDQIEAIENRVGVFFEGIDPPWSLVYRGGYGEISTSAFTNRTSPMVPTRDNLKRLAADGASVAPENLAQLWHGYLTFLAENTLPAEFLDQGIRI